MKVGTIKLFRAVSSGEWADIQSSGIFRTIPSSMQGHWFAEVAADALTWGQRLYQVFGQPFFAVEVEMPTHMADLLFRLPRLDNIGPARFADCTELAIINQSKTGDICLSSISP